MLGFKRHPDLNYDITSILTGFGKFHLLDIFTTSLKT